MVSWLCMKVRGGVAEWGSLTKAVTTADGDSTNGSRGGRRRVKARRPKIGVRKGEGFQTVHLGRGGKRQDNEKEEGKGCLSQKKGGNREVRLLPRPEGVLPEKGGPEIRLKEKDQGHRGARKMPEHRRGKELCLSGE